MDDEDEEVVLKNTGLYSHLRGAGFDDFEFVPESNSNICRRLSSGSNEPKMLDTHMYSENKRMDCEAYLETLLDSNLIFSDDILFIKNFAVCLKPGSFPSSILIKSFRSVYVPIIIDTIAVSTVCCVVSVFGAFKLTPRILFACHVIPVSLRCLKYVHTAFNEFKRKKILKNVVESLKSLTLLVQRSIRFVKESEILAVNEHRFRDEIIDIKSRSAEDLMLHQLRETIFTVVRSIILEFKNMIISLVGNFPLKAPVDSVDCNLAFLNESELHCQRGTSSISSDHLQKIRYVFLLLQSEFLRQLCLCFTTPLWTHDSNKSVSAIFRRLDDFNLKCTRFHTILKSSFDTHYLQERLPRKNRNADVDSSWLYAEAYLKLNSVSSNLQSVLRESLSLEEYLESIKLSENVSDDVMSFLERQSDEISAKYMQCVPAIEDFRRYVARLRPRQSARLEPDNPVLETPETTCKTNIMLGVTDFNPKCPDEVFVGVSESKQMDECKPDDTDVVIQRCSKFLIKELKIALQDRAKEWKEREKAALQRKNETDSDPEMPMDFNSDDEVPRRKKKQRVHLEPKDVPFVPIKVTESSFAKQIASVSASWGMQEEEFCDHEQTDEDV